MTKFIDIKPSDWFYNEVVEASSINLEDGNPFVVGIEYGNFETNAPYVYEEFVSGASQKIFTLSKKIVPTPNNPLYVYVDGVQTMFKELKDNSSGTTDVELYVGIRQGAVVSFASYGIPKVDSFGKPVATSLTPAYPTHVLSKGNLYRYERFGRGTNEYMYAFGRGLFRAEVTPSDWDTLSGQQVARKYIGIKQDVYCISPGGVVYLPYNLNNVTCRVTYAFIDGYLRTHSESFRPTSPQVLHNNRFFPSARISRAEAFVLMNRLRQTFYSRFSDTKAPTYRLDQRVMAFNGQRAVKINGKYPAGEGKLVVRLNGGLCAKDIHYIEHDKHTILFIQPLNEGDIVHLFYEKLESARLPDVGRETFYEINSTGERVRMNGVVPGSWWGEHVLAMEDETFRDGSYLIAGIPTTNRKENNTVVVVGNDYNPHNTGASPSENWFMPSTLMTRAQAVSILNRFRHWCVERFK